MENSLLCMFYLTTIAQLVRDSNLLPPCLYFLAIGDIRTMNNSILFMKHRGEQCK
jgi:hypothetical protein